MSQEAWNKWGPDDQRGALKRDYGIALLEGLMLDPLVASGRHEFMFVASPLPPERTSIPEWRAR